MFFDLFQMLPFIKSWKICSEVMLSVKLTLENHSSAYFKNDNEIYRNMNLLQQQTCKKTNYQPKRQTATVGANKLTLTLP